ncbi:MAG: hypothetical protein AAFZ10_01615 [Pseudomonadota bacterium]
MTAIATEQEILSIGPPHLAGKMVPYDWQSNNFSCTLKSANGNEWFQVFSSSPALDEYCNDAQFAVDEYFRVSARDDLASFDVVDLSIHGLAPVGESNFSRTDTLQNQLVWEGKTWFRLACTFGYNADWQAVLDANSEVPLDDPLPQKTSPAFGTFSELVRNSFDYFNVTATTEQKEVFFVAEAFKDDDNPWQSIRRGNDK